MLESLKRLTAMRAKTNANSSPQKCLTNRPLDDLLSIIKEHHFNNMPYKNTVKKEPLQINSINARKICYNSVNGSRFLVMRNLNRDFSMSEPRNPKLKILRKKTRTNNLSSSVSTYREKTHIYNSNFSLVGMKVPVQMQEYNIKSYKSSPDPVIRIQKIVTPSENTPLIELKKMKRPESRSQSRAQTASGRYRATRNNCAIRPMAPLTPEKYKNISQRIYFARRVIQCNEKILIINFEGVIGDYIQTSFWNSENKQLYIRSQAIKSLQNLSEKFQIVLFFESVPEKSQICLNYLNQHGIYIDAAYQFIQNLNNPWSSEHKNYEQIYEDFQIEQKIEQKIIIIGCYSHDLPENIKVINSEYKNKIISTAIPIINYKYNKIRQIPITILVQDPKIHPTYYAVPFDNIENIIFKLTNGNMNFEEGFNKLRKIPNKNMLAFETNEICLFYKEQTELHNEIIKKRDLNFKKIRMKQNENSPQKNPPQTKNSSTAAQIAKYVELLTCNEKSKEQIAAYYYYIKNHGEKLNYKIEEIQTDYWSNKIIIMLEKGFTKYAPVVNIRKSASKKCL